MGENLKTTLGSTGIASSFTKAGGDGRPMNYFVSTVKDAGGYVTLVKEAGLTKKPIAPYPIFAIDAKEATINHIASTRMCLSSDSGEWSEATISDYRPEQIIEFIDANLSKPSGDAPLLNEYTHNMLSMAGINYPPPKSGKAGLVIAIAIICILAFVIFSH